MNLIGGTNILLQYSCNKYFTLLNGDLGRVSCGNWKIKKKKTIWCGGQTQREQPNLRSLRAVGEMY